MRLRSFLVALALMIGSMVVPSFILAHAGYDRSTPSPGQVVSTSPTIVEMFTKQDVRRQAGSNSLTVEDERGTRVNDGDVQVDDSNRRRLTVKLRSDLPPGRYVVRFRTLSDEDGESDGGAFAFYVGAQPTDAQRQLDAQLHLSDDAPASLEGGAASLVPVVGGIVAVVFVALLAVTGWLVFRGRRSAT